MIFACKPTPDSRLPLETVSLLANTRWSDAQRPQHFNTEIDREDVGGLALCLGPEPGCV